MRAHAQNRELHLRAAFLAEAFEALLVFFEELFPTSSLSSARKHTRFSTQLLKHKHLSWIMETPIM